MRETQIKNQIHQGVLVMFSMIQVELRIGPHFIQVGSTSVPTTKHDGMIGL